MEEGGHALQWVECITWSLIEERSRSFDQSMNSHLDEANGISTAITPSQPTRLHEAFYASPLSDLPI